MDSERAKMNWLNRLLGNYPNAESTEELAFPAMERHYDEEKVIRPSVVNMVFLTLFAGFALLFWFTFLKMVIKGILLPVTVTFLIFVTGILTLIVWQAFLNPRYNYIITIGKFGIQVRDKIWTWKEIDNTYIMWLPARRRPVTYLLIFLRNDEVEKFNLFNFSISTKRIAEIIEYYKLQYISEKSTGV